MKQTRKVRAGKIDTATLHAPIHMVAGDVEQRPMPIEYADEPDDDAIDGKIVFLIVALFAILAYMIIVS